MKLKRGIQTKIKQATGFSAAYISDILNGKVRLTSWPTAKTFAAATNTTPYLWLEGSPEDIQTGVSDNNTWEAE